MSSDITYTTEQYRYDVDKQKWVLRQGHELIQNFKFSGREFFLTHKGHFYFICTNYKNNELYTLVNFKDTEDGYKLTPGEVSSKFRKEYLKRKISDEQILDFIREPLKFAKK